MVKCDRCGKDTYIPFRCSYCGGYFCEEHRLPEFHGCTGIQRGTGFSYGSRTREPFDSFYTTPRSGDVYLGSFRFSRMELRDLAIGLMIIVALPVTWFGNSVFRNPLFVLEAVVIFAAAFILHELAHKFSAQRMGYWSEFRLNAFGLIITLISFFSPLKIVAPGAVIVAGPLYSRDYGRISIAGPLTNIALAMIFLMIEPTLSTRIFWIGAYINSILALFNLIPFGLFDGAKVFRWDWKAWLASVAVAGTLFLYTAVS